MPTLRPRRPAVPLLRLGGVVDAFGTTMHAFYDLASRGDPEEARRLAGMARELRREAWALAGVGLDNMLACSSKPDALLLARRPLLASRLAAFRRHYPRTWRVVARPQIDELRAIALTLRIRRRYEELAAATPESE